MLIIRQEQIQHFIAEGEDQLTQAVVEAVRAASAERVEGYEDEKLVKMVERGIERARSHKLERAEDIAAFVAVMFEIAPGFDEQEQIKTVLADENFPPGERLYQLFERVSDEAWQEAETFYNERFWFPAKDEN